MKAPTKYPPLIDELVTQYEKEQNWYTMLVNSLRLVPEDPVLAKYIHSVKWRVKDPEHLREKLERKWDEANSGGPAFDITPDTLFTRITDLAGLRILHLYTRQIEHINARLLTVLDELMYKVVDGPFARIWDNEYKQMYESFGIRTETSDTMYTSVHYVVKANTRTAITGEIQVRTLAEEIWGEVDHTINYPRVSPKLACREQIKVLARVSSSCSRLVDSIFATHEEGGPQGTSVEENAGVQPTANGQSKAVAKRVSSRPKRR